MPEIGGYLNKEKKYEGWVDYDGGRVKFVAISMSDHLKIQKKAQRKVGGQLGAKKYETDVIKSNNLLGRAVLLDWEGFTKNGADLPFSIDDAICYMNESVAFSAFVNEVALDLINYAKEEQEGAEKN